MYDTYLTVWLYLAGMNKNVAMNGTLYIQKGNFSPIIQTHRIIQVKNRLNYTILPQTDFGDA